MSKQFFLEKECDICGDTLLISPKGIIAGKFCKHDNCACARELGKGKKDEKYHTHGYWICVGNPLSISVG